MSTLFEDQRKIPLISMYRPWANWVALEWKRIETRLHNRFKNLVGQTIAIHAGRWDDDALETAKPYLTDDQYEETMLWQHKAQPAVICTAFVYRARLCVPVDATDALIECDTERHGLFLNDIRPVIPPIEMKGHQGIWRAFVDVPVRTQGVQHDRVRRSPLC